MENEKRRHVVIVDDNPVNLDLAENVLKDHYKLTKLISGQQLLRFLTRIKPDMILLDIQMPELDGFETLEKVKKIPGAENIPVIFLTGQKDSTSEQEGFRLGANDFITKPFDNGIMLSRVHAQMELFEYRNNLEDIIAVKKKEIADLQHVITISWAEMVESRDGTTGSHVRNATHYFEVLLKLFMGIPEYQKLIPPNSYLELVRASTLHDIGKIGISDLVLKKPGPLTKEEFADMKTHSQIGADMIQKIIDQTHPEPFLVYAKEMANYHHERWDGTGYPCGLKGKDIPFYVRILSLADVYDALTSIRPYKRAFTHAEALEIMIKDRGSFYEPDIFDLFLENSDFLLSVTRE